jgi:hypothetical protein
VKFLVVSGEREVVTALYTLQCAFFESHSMVLLVPSVIVRIIERFLMVPVARDFNHSAKKSQVR